MTVDTLVIVTAAVALGAVLKGITGVGGPIVAIPVMAAFLGVERAVVVMAIPAVAMNGVLLWQYRGEAIASGQLSRLLLAGAIGVAVGTWALASLDDELLSGLLAVALVAYLAVRWRQPQLELAVPVRRVLDPVVGLGSGLMQGSTGISAPLVATYVHGFNLPRAGYVFAVSALFQVFSLAQVVAITSVGLYTPARLAESALACVPAVAFTPLGDWIGRRLSARAFEAVLTGSLAGLAAKLVYDAVAG